MLVGLCFWLLQLAGQKVSVDLRHDVYVAAGDSATLLFPKGIVISAGDTVSVMQWYASNDTASWRELRGFDRKVVADSNSFCLDTVPAFRFYRADIKQPASINYIIWEIENVTYLSLNVPDVFYNGRVAGDDIFFLKGDSVSLNYSFIGLQPDRIVWRLNGGVTNMPVTKDGACSVAGYLYNPKGATIDMTVSENVYLSFVEQPVGKFIFKSWAGSNDGRPKLDTIVIDGSVKEYVIDTLVFALSNPYRYQFVPVLRGFDASYQFKYKWEYNEFAFVNLTDSVLDFDPIGFKHCGSYRLVLSRNGVSYYSPFIRITAFNTAVEDIQSGYVTDGVVYDLFGIVVASGVSGYYPDVVRDLRLRRGVYVLRDGGRMIKFVKGR